MSTSEDLKWELTNYINNKNYNFNREKILNICDESNVDDAYNTISKWKDYKPTPLVNLVKLSNKLKLNNIFYKDESKRFHLKSFKALGGAYAVEKTTQGNKNIIVATATAGNHGRSVAWGAQRLGLNCKIFISEYVSEARAASMRNLDAEVIRVNGNYENSKLKLVCWCWCSENDHFEEGYRIKPSSGILPASPWVCSSPSPHLLIRS